VRLIGYEPASRSSVAESNPASERVAERVGYVREGVVRSCWFKEDIRDDLGIWSRLRTDP
jgi:RimJ/RimL family protein N-acetyltransferase